MGMGQQEPGSWGAAGRRQGMAVLKLREGQIPGPGTVSRNKGAPMIWPSPQTAAPSPQLPLPPTSLGMALGMQSPPAPHTLKQQPLSPEPPLTSDPLNLSRSPAGSPTETQPLSSPPHGLDGGRQALEQPEPGQQRLHHLLAQHPQHQGLSFLVGPGRKAKQWAFHSPCSLALGSQPPGRLWLSGTSDGNGGWLTP